MSSIKLRKFFNFFLGVAALAALCYGFYRFLVWVAHLFSQVNPTVGAGMLAAMSAILVSVLSVLIAKHLEQKALIAKEQRDKKVPTYEDLIEFLFLMIHGERMARGPLSEQEQVERMSRFNQRVIVWGSDEVIAAFASFRQMSFTGQSSLVIAASVEQLLMAIRKDLGHRNKGLGPGSILRTFINDLHNLV